MLTLKVDVIRHEGWSSWAGCRSRPSPSQVPATNQEWSSIPVHRSLARLLPASARRDTFICCHCAAGTCNNGVSSQAIVCENKHVAKQDTVFYHALPITLCTYTFLHVRALLRGQRNKLHKQTGTSQRQAREEKWAVCDRSARNTCSQLLCCWN